MPIRSLGMFFTKSVYYFDKTQIHMRLVHDIRWGESKEEKHVDFSNKSKYYVQIDRDTESNGIYEFLDEVQRDGKYNIENLLNNSDT